MAVAVKHAKNGHAPGTPDIDRVPIGIPDDDAAHLVECRVEGRMPLLMHATRPDVTDPLVREMESLTSKRKKTIDDQQRVQRLDWQMGLYHDGDAPYIPAKNVMEAMRHAATKWKLGTAVYQNGGVQILDARVPLIYDGPRDIDGLWDAGFRDVQMVRNGGFNAGRVPRCRPRFDEWALEWQMLVTPSELDLDQLGMIMGRVRNIGLGDYRPLFGRLNVTKLDKVAEGWSL